MRIELGLMFILTLVCALALWVVFRGIPTASPPTNLTPADAIDDLWSLVRVPVKEVSSVFPPAMVEWVKRFNSDLLFARIPWVNPRLHPWRFTTAVGLLVGVLLVIAQLQEGPPPSLGYWLVAGRHLHLGRARRHPVGFRHLWGLPGSATRFDKEKPV